MSQPARLVAHAWGVTREWIPMLNVPESPRRYVLQGKPFVPFEEQGHTLVEIEQFYPAVDRYWA
jgi:hypothetical protein